MAGSAASLEPRVKLPAYLQSPDSPASSQAPSAPPTPMSQRDPQSPSNGGGDSYDDGYGSQSQYDDNSRDFGTSPSGGGELGDTGDRLAAMIKDAEGNALLWADVKAGAGEVLDSAER